MQQQRRCGGGCGTCTDTRCVDVHAPVTLPVRPGRTPFVVVAGAVGWFDRPRSFLPTAAAAAAAWVGWRHSRSCGGRVPCGVLDAPVCLPLCPETLVCAGGMVTVGNRGIPYYIGFVCLLGVRVRPHSTTANPSRVLSRSSRGFGPWTDPCLDCGRQQRSPTLGWLPSRRRQVCVAGGDGAFGSFGCGSWWSTTMNHRPKERSCIHPLTPVDPSNKGSYLVDPASSHMLVSKIKPCMSKYKLCYTVKLRMAH